MTFEAKQLDVARRCAEIAANYIDEEPEAKPRHMRAGIRDAIYREYGLEGAPANAKNVLTSAQIGDRELLAQWMIQNGYTTGHGDTVEALLGELDAQRRKQMQYRDRIEKDQAHRLGQAARDMAVVYAERDRLVAALSKLFPASLGRHPQEEPWEDDWRWIVFIDLPTGQVSWHMHDSELPWFAHLLPPNEPPERKWDGHTTEEKYERLSKLEPSKPPMLHISEVADWPANFVAGELPAGEYHRGDVIQLKPGRGVDTCIHDFLPNPDFDVRICQHCRAVKGPKAAFVGLLNYFQRRRMPASMLGELRWIGE